MLFPVLQFRNEMPSNNGNAVIGLYVTEFEVDAKATILLIEDVCRRNIGHTGIVRWHFKLRPIFIADLSQENRVKDHWAHYAIISFKTPIVIADLPHRQAHYAIISF